MVSSAPCPLTHDDLHQVMACFRKALEMTRYARPTPRGWDCLYCWEGAEWPSEIAHREQCHVLRMRRLLDKLVGSLERDMRAGPSPINEAEG